MILDPKDFTPIYKCPTCGEYVNYICESLAPSMPGWLHRFECKKCGEAYQYNTPFSVEADLYNEPMSDYVYRRWCERLKQMEEHKNDENPHPDSTL